MWRPSHDFPVKPGLPQLPTKPLHACGCLAMSRLPFRSVFGRGSWRRLTTLATREVPCLPIWIQLASQELGKNDESALWRLGMAGHGWAWLGYQALTLSSPLSASKRPCGVMAATKLDQLSKTSNRSAMVGHSTMLHISLWHLGAKLRSISGVTPYLRPLHWENS